MSKIQVVQGDITTIKVDAIVNAANNGLLGGGGVDGAIHRAGGAEILAECRKIGYCPTGEAVITTAGNLPAKYVIHTVGPVWNGGHKDEESLLANAYKNSLRLAMDYKVKSIAFPNISTGIYGYPKDQAARIAVQAARGFLQENHTELSVTFVCFDKENFSLYKELI